MLLRSTLLLLLFALIGMHSLVLAQPTLKWVKGIGNSLGTERGSVYQSDSGAVYLSGLFDGTMDFDPGVGVFNLSSAGSNDIFIAKYDTLGQLIWAIRLGSSSSDQVLNLVADAAGNIYVTGSFSSTVDFDPGPGVFSLSSAGAADIFVAKYTSTGNFIWAKKMGGTSGESGADIRLDQWNNVYVCGRFAATVNFDPGLTNFSLTSAGNTDVFMFKLDAAGAFLWAKRLGGSDLDFSNKFCVSEDGIIYITGSFRGTADFDPNAGVQNRTSSGTNDIFLGKYDTDGNYIWAVRAGSSDIDNGMHVEIAHDNNVVLFCTYSLTVDFDPGPLYQPLSSSGITDVAVVKFTSDGEYLWAKRFGNSNYDWVQDAGISQNGAIYFTGYFDGTLDMDPNAGVTNITTAGSYDAYINKLDPDGNFVWAKRGGGTSTDYGYYLDVSPTNDVYYSGIFSLQATFDFGLNDTLNTNGSYDTFFARIANCADSTSVSAIVCDTFNFDGQILTQSGNYDRTYYTALGCDSLVQLQLFVQSSNYTDTLANACSNFPWRGTNYTSSGIYGDTLSSTLGCDSIIRLNLTIYPTSVTADTVESCESYFWNSNNYTSSGIYYDTLTNQMSCDSVLSLNLTIHSTAFSSSSVSVCDSTNWMGNTLTSSGIYEDTLTTIYGCDSIVQLNLTVNYAVITDTSATSCDAFSWRGTNYSISGIYTDSLSTVAGCDSILRLYLTIEPSTGSIETVEACEFYTWHGNSFTNSGLYSDTLTNQFGCDSITVLDLTVHFSVTFSTTITACNSYIWQGSTYNSSGIYSLTLTNQNGCDSILNLNLTIETIDNSVTQSGSTLTTNASGVNYQWIDCTNSNQVISGENQQTYTATDNGAYAVIVSLGSCTDTSACFVFDDLGLPSFSFSKFIIYPNPSSNGIFFVGNASEINDLRVFDLSGNIVNAHYDSETGKIDGSTLMNGSYLIRGTIDGVVHTRKLVVLK